MKRDALILIRGLLLMAAGMVAAMAVELALDLVTSGYPLGNISTMNIAEARHVTNAFNRSFNQLVGVAFTTIAIAVPLTANMYSLKFLEYIIKDRVVAATLILAVFGNLNNLWIAYAMKDDFVPVIAINFAMVLAILSFALLFPYLIYVFRFLHPNTLLDRLEEEIKDLLQQAVRQPKKAPRYRRQVADGIEHIANIAIRSVDRSDRNTAIESVHTLERVAHAYWRIKSQLSPSWFEAEPALFLGFASKAVAEFNAERGWVEMKLYSQLRQVMSAAVPKMHDLSSTVAKTLRRLGLDETTRRDPVLREMVMEYFNTFIRLATVRKDARTVFTLFDQYRTFAESLNADCPDLVQEIAYYFDYYGQVARENGLPFLIESIAHDLGSLVQQAYQSEASNRRRLLERFLHYDQVARTVLPGVKKAQAILASYLLMTGYGDEAELISRSFGQLDPALLHSIQDDLLSIKREKFWEVNERRINMDYVPDAQREKLKQFFDGVKPARAS